MAVKAGVQQQAQSVKRTRSARGRFDYMLILAVAALLIVGLMMTYSATFDWSYRDHGNSFLIASRQFIWVGLGVIAMVAAAVIPYDRWQQAAVPVMGVTLLLLVRQIISVIWQDS